MPRKKFEALVEKTILNLPRFFREKIKNVSIMVDDWPAGKAKGKLILGFYHGVPFPYRGPFYGNVTPDFIVIYQGPIESLCRSEQEVEEVVRKVVLHEIGHYFGLTEADLARLEKEIEDKNEN